LAGIDLKGAGGGGYVLAPPSSIPAGAYSWADPEIPVAEFPAEILRELRGDEKATRGRKKLKGLTGAPPANPAPGPDATLYVKEGTRHPRLLELAGAWRAKDLPEDEIEWLLWMHATRFFDPPFSQDNPAHVREIEDIARWIGEKPPNEAAATTPTIEPLTVLSTRPLRALP